MGRYFKPGCWNALCDVCGVEFKSDELRKRWDGLMVCSRDYETRHPQDLIRVPKDDPHVPWARPDNDTFIEFCTLYSVNGVAGVGAAGCAVAGKNNGFRL